MAKSADIMFYFIIMLYVYAVENIALQTNIFFCFSKSKRMKYYVENIER